MIERNIRVPELILWTGTRVALAWVTGCLQKGDEADEFSYHGRRWQDVWLAQFRR